MNTVLITPAMAAKEVLPVVRDAIKAEVVRLDLAIEAAVKRLASFETTYRVTSEEFMEQKNSWSA